MRERRLQVLNIINRDVVAGSTTFVLHPTFSISPQYFAPHFLNSLIVFTNRPLFSKGGGRKFSSLSAVYSLLGKYHPPASESGVEFVRINLEAPTWKSSRWKLPPLEFLGVLKFEKQFPPLFSRRINISIILIFCSCGLYLSSSSFKISADLNVNLWLIRKRRKKKNKGLEV